MRRRDLLMLGLLAPSAAASMAVTAPAQDRYPSRPVRLAIPASAGGVHDVIGRVWAEKIRPHFGPVVIGNRGGGGGLIAPPHCRRAQPRRYTPPLGRPPTPLPVPP